MWDKALITLEHRVINKNKTGVFLWLNDIILKFLELKTKLNGLKNI